MFSRRDTTALYFFIFLSFFISLSVKEMKLGLKYTLLSKIYGMSTSVSTAGWDLPTAAATDAGELLANNEPRSKVRRSSCSSLSSSSFY
jgi:hypothetical protein